MREVAKSWAKDIESWLTNEESWWGKSFDWESWLTKKVDWHGKLIEEETQFMRKVDEFEIWSCTYIHFGYLRSNEAGENLIF